ncbi:tetraacyldisaccharide 4'-kinase [Persephonella sp.]
MLNLLSSVYGFGARLRRKLYTSGIKKAKKLPVPVVSIGNLSVGGTGKTPLTISLSKQLQKKGYRVCVLSRGYRRKSRGTAVVSDGKKIYVDWQEAGDEPFLIAAEGIPVVVSEDRYTAGIKALEYMDVDLFILDDGFQHFQLYRDADLLVVDAVKPFWEDRLLPAGRLREPPEFYRFAHFFVVNRFNRLKQEEKEKFLNSLKNFGKSYFFTEEKIEGIIDSKKVYGFDLLTGKDVGLFSGLGNNLQFFRLIEELSEKYSFKVINRVQFPDHYSYESFKLPEFPKIWLTTEKDIIKLPLSERNRIFAVKYRLEVDTNLIDILEKKIFYEKDKNGRTQEQKNV